MMVVTGMLVLTHFAEVEIFNWRMKAGGMPVLEYD